MTHTRNRDLKCTTHYWRILIFFFSVCNVYKFVFCQNISIVLRPVTSTARYQSFNFHSLFSLVTNVPKNSFPLAWIFLSFNNQIITTAQTNHVTATKLTVSITKNNMSCKNTPKRRQNNPSIMKRLPHFNFLFHLRMAQILLHHQVKCFHKLRSKTKENNAHF